MRAGDPRGRRRVEALAQPLEATQIEQRQLAVARPAVEPRMLAARRLRTRRAAGEAGAGIAGRHGFARRDRPQAQVAQAWFCGKRQALSTMGVGSACAVASATGSGSRWPMMGEVGERAANSAWWSAANSS